MQSNQGRPPRISSGSADRGRKSCTATGLNRREANPTWQFRLDRRQVTEWNEIECFQTSSAGIVALEKSRQIAEEIVERPSEVGPRESGRQNPFPSIWVGRCSRWERSGTLTATGPTSGSTISSCRTGATRHDRIAHLRSPSAGRSAESVGRGDQARRLARVDVDPVDRADLPAWKAQRGLGCPHRTGHDRRRGAIDDPDIHVVVEIGVHLGRFGCFPYTAGNLIACRSPACVMSSRRLRPRSMPHRKRRRRIPDDRKSAPRQPSDGAIRHAQCASREALRRRRRKPPAQVLRSSPHSRPGCKHQISAQSQHPAPHDPAENFTDGSIRPVEQLLGVAAVVREIDLITGPRTVKLRADSLQSKTAPSIKGWTWLPVVHERMSEAGFRRSASLRNQRWIVVSRSSRTAVSLMRSARGVHRTRGNGAGHAG